MAQVLRDMYNLPDEIIFNEYLELVKKLNPDLEDMNLVKPDQTIVLPSADAYRLLPRTAAFPEEAVKEEETAEDKRERERELEPATVAEKEEEVKSDDVIKEDIASIGETQPTGREEFPVSPGSSYNKVSYNMPLNKDAYIKSMSSVAGIFYGKLHRLGDISIPLMDESRITIDTNTFPILQLTDEKRIILDYGGDLPPDLVDLVQLEPGNYEVVTLKKNENMKSALDKIFDAAGYFSVDKSRSPLVLGNQVQFEISGDWVIYRDEIMQDIMVVNMLDTDDPPVDVRLKKSANDFGVNIIDVYMVPDGKEVSFKQAEVAEIKAADIPVIDVSNGEVLVDSLLGLLGQQYKKNHVVELFRGKSAGYDIEIKADRYFERDGMRHIISFHPVSQRLVNLIIKKGDRVLDLPLKVNDSLKVIANLLSFMQLNYEAPCPVFFDSAGNKKRVSLSVPGVLIKRNNREDILLTSSELKEPLYQFLAGNGIKVYRISSSG